MDNTIYVETIQSIMSSQSVGYSFVKSFIDTLWKNKETLYINNYVMIWDVQYTSESMPQKFIEFSNDLGFDISSLKVEDMMMLKQPVDSKEKMFLRFFIKDTFKNSHIIAIPINAFSHDASYFNTKGVLLLFAQQRNIDIGTNELNSFHILLNSRRPCVQSNDSVCESLSYLAKSESRKATEYTECFQHIGYSLDCISNKNGEKSIISGLRHFSLWNYIHANVDLKSKSFSRNTYKDIAHNNTNTIILEDDKHFINNASTLYQKEEGVQILKCLSFNEGKSSFKDIEYFEDNDLSDANTTIIVAADGDGDLDYKYPDRILNFYISNIIYTPFISISFIKSFSKSITNNIRKSLVTSRDRILTDLMNASMFSSKESDFYFAASTIIRKANEAEDVLIFLKNEHKYEFKNVNNYETRKYGELEIPNIYISDKSFVAWLNECIEKYVNAFYVSTNKTIVRSAAYMQTNIGQTGRSCVIFLINKQHQPSTTCVYYNNIFDKDNYYITDQCGVFMVQYQMMQDSIRSKNYLLHKLRHEIPSCTEAIDKGLFEIKKNLDDIDVSRKHILNITNNLALNNSRVLLLAKFFSTVDFDAEKFAKDKIRINVASFLNSYIEIFRTEGKYKGVDVYFYQMDEGAVYINASNYFQLALVNVVTNAIRYAASGTCVFIDIYDHKIVVRDLGIGIPEDEKEMIFKEGYRGKEAKKVNEKGMGYGLYLTRKVLEAHNFQIGVESNLFYNKNYFAESALLIYLDTLSLNERRKFILNGLDNPDIPNALALFEEVKDSRKIVEIGKGYANLKLDTIISWISYLSDNNVVFYDMFFEVFQKPLYEVSFVIQF